MKKWQYKIRGLYPDMVRGGTYWNDDSSLDLLERLNKLGEEGWELTAVYDEDNASHTFIWKRPYKDFPPATPDDDE